MQDTEAIADELRRAHDGEAWHGPGVREALEGVKAAQAAARPVANAHSIWEIALHVTGWTREVGRRLAGNPPGLPAEGDWPAVPEPPTEERWQAAKAAAEAAHHELADAVAAFPAGRLDERVGSLHVPELGTGFTYRGMLHGLSQHSAYHGGQIVILKKALGDER